MRVILRPMTPSTAAAVLAGKAPDDVTVAADYPTEFSVGVASRVGGGSPLGPFCIHEADGDVVVGEVGGGFARAGVIEIGYAVVPSCRGRGCATSAVVALIERARQVPGVERIAAHTPLDRPASGRVLVKAGFSFVGETDDEREGVALRVKRWEFRLSPAVTP